MAVTDRVIVVGAGPVGLTATYWLARLGIPVVTLERESGVPSDMRASTFHPPTMDLMEEFGITPQLIAAGVPAPRWQIRVHETKESVIFDLGVLARETAHPYRLQCEQARLNRILVAEVEKLDPAALRFGAEVTGVAQDENGVSVTVTRGGATEVLTGRYVIGADGARSLVRTTFGIGFEGKAYPETLTLTVTDFPFEDHIPGLLNVNYHWRESGNYSLMKVPGCWRSGSRLREGQELADVLGDDAVEARMQDIWPKAGRYNILYRGSYRAHRRIADTFNRGRAFLAGDAAHLNDPQGGMGMNSGIHDAINLAHTIRAVLDGGDAARFDRYTRQRRTVATDEVQENAEALRTVIREKEWDARIGRLRQMQAIAADPERLKAFLLKTSMISGLRKAMSIT
jgi:3-(3-hydroxy-phenyl)propionate hydroxylase